MYATLCSLSTELGKTSDNLRQEVLSLKETIAQRDQQLKKMELELRLGQEELQKAHSSSSTVSEKMATKEKELDDVRLLVCNCNFIPF